MSSIDEFLSDLTIFATGSYLRPDERELWEPPFPESAVAEVRQILEQFSVGLDNADSAAEAEATALSCVDALVALNAAYIDALFDDEEYSELAEIINANVASHGYPEPNVNVDSFVDIDEVIPE